MMSFCWLRKRRRDLVVALLALASIPSAQAQYVRYADLVGTWASTSSRQTIAFDRSGAVIDGLHPRAVGKTTAFPRNGASLSVDYTTGAHCDLSAVISTDRKRLLLSLVDATQRTSCVSGVFERQK